MFAGRKVTVNPGTALLALLSVVGLTVRYDVNLRTTSEEDKTDNFNQFFV
jgi:hypothetical protein